jgi:uncharacterized protein (DUF952 family)
MRIFHIATKADWEQARTAGSYATSTRGQSLEDVGFIHAAHRPQVRPVFQRYYRDVREPLVLLTIDTDRLDVPWREDEVGEESFPHIYGPLSAKAVVGVQPLNKGGGTETFTALFVKEMVPGILLAVVAMLLAAGGSLVGRGLGTEWGELAGAVAGLVVGIVVAVLVMRRR